MENPALLQEKVKDAQVGEKRPRSYSKGELDGDSGSKRKRPSGKYMREGASLDWYLGLYNIVIAEREQYVENDLPASQVGSSWWTTGEKEAFFQALDTIGRDNIKSLSDKVGTKSQPEVEEYLQNLQYASGDGVYRQRRSQITRLELPIAVDIPADVDDALEVVGDELAYRQEIFEKNLHRDKYGKLSLLSIDAIDVISAKDFKVEDHIPTTDPLFKDASAAIDTLQLKNFLGLSSHVYMNSSDPQWNYNTYNMKGEEPSMQLSAFVDLYRIFRMVLERLMLASLHCRASRMRSSDRKASNRKASLKKRDVEAALQVLSLAKTTNRNQRFDYWVSILRTYKIQAWLTAQRGRLSIPLHYHEAESYLRRPLRGPHELETSELEFTPLQGNNVEEWRAHYFPNTKPIRPRVAEQEVSEADDESGTSHFAWEGDADTSYTRLEIDNVDASATDITNSIDGRIDEEEMQYDDYNEGGESMEEGEEEEEFLEECDKVSSAREVAYLRQMCAINVVDESSSKLEDPQPKFPIYPSRGQNSVDWRVGLPYKSEWERFSEPLLASGGTQKHSSRYSSGDVRRQASDNDVDLNEDLQNEERGEERTGSEGSQEDSDDEQGSTGVLTASEDADGEARNETATSSSEPESSTESSDESDITTE